MKKEHYVLTIKAEDRPGLLHLITGVLNRKLIPIISLTASPTDVHGIVLVTIEVELSNKALQPLIFKLENIIEVFEVEPLAADEGICRRSAYFLVDKAILTSTQSAVISKLEAQLVYMKDDTILLTRSGNDDSIQRLYNELSGSYLLGFSQTGIIVNSALIAHQDGEQSSVISRLAA